MTQETALKVLKTGANVFLTGEPGAGKTHTVNAYVSYLRSCGIEPAITASTGIAATHIGGMTIHSWTGIGIQRSLSDYDVDRIATVEYVVKRIAKTRVLIIDEISMLDRETLESIDKVCRAIKQNEDAFGGIQIVLVGDFFQLPPVSKFGEKKSEFAFYSNAWNSLNLFICYLSEQHRQEDVVFLELLSAMRKNQITEDHQTILNGRIEEFEDYEQTGITKLYSHNEDVDRINLAELGRIEGGVEMFKMTSSGKEALVTQLKRGCLSTEELVLKAGAIVMFTKNSPKGDYVNGTLGEIVGFDEDTGYPIVLTKRGKEIVAEPVEWMVEEGGKKLASISQIPLRLAWAMTVHKSQGMSLDAAFVDLRSAFVPGQGYVAFSRVRTLKGLYLLGYNQAALHVHPEVLIKDHHFRQNSKALNEKFEVLPKKELSRLHKNFILAVGGKVTSKRKRLSKL